MPKGRFYHAGRYWWMAQAMNEIVSIADTKAVGNLATPETRAESLAWTRAAAIAKAALKFWPDDPSCRTMPSAKLRAVRVKPPQ